MKIRRLLLLLVLALVVPWAANAQSLWEYTLTVGTETYTSIADESLLLTSVNGDGGSQTVTLPFEFKFGEATYPEGTQVTVRADGYLYFSGSYSDHHIRGAWTRTDCKVIVPFLAEDGNLTSNGATSGAYCSTDDPDHPTMLIVEFKGLKRYYNLGDYNFQVRLHSNGNISTVYGESSLHLSSDTYHNFFLTNGSDKICLTGSYAEPVAGTPSVLPNFTEAPSVGQVITYVRPVITCPKPTDLEATLVPGDGSKTNLSWTENGAAENWMVEYSTADDFANAQTYNGSFNVEGSIVSCQLTGLTPEQTYYVHVKADCGEGDQSNWCLAVSFIPSDAFFVNDGTYTVGNVPLVGNYKSSYDQMIYTADQLQSAGINGPCSITRIGFNSSSDNSYKRLPVLYMGTTDKSSFDNSTDFITVYDLTEVYSREYSSNLTDQDLWTITPGWNEFELDTPFEYDGSGNLVIAMHCDLAFGYASTSFFGNGLNANQVVMAFDDNNNPDPIQYDGHWSDYSGYKSVSRVLPTLKVYAESVTCTKPTGLAIVANSLTAHEVSFTWDYEAGQSFQYALIQGNMTEIDESDYTETWDSGDDFPSWNTLGADTDWTFFLRKNCGSDGFSTPVYVNFHTNPTCPAPENLAVVAGSETSEGATVTWEGANDRFVVEIGSYDLTAAPTPVTILEEGFEDGIMPDGWTNEGSAGYNWRINQGYGYNNVAAHDGVYNALLPHNDRNNATYLVTSVMDFSSYASVTLSCWFINMNWGTSDIEEFGVYYRYTDSDKWHQLFHTTTNHETWVQTNEIELPCEPFIQIGFLGVDHYGRGIGLDDITIQGMQYPLTWNVVADNETGNAYTFTQLDDNQTYHARVKAICGDDDPSPYSNVVSFTTLKACPTPSVFVLGEVTNNSAAFSWNGGTADEWKVWVKESTEMEYPADYTLVQNTASATLINLTDNTEYDVLIAPACDETKVLEVLNAFVTDCNAITITNESPFKEGFEDWTADTYNHFATDGVYPDCWRSYSEGTIYPHIINSGDYNFVHNGSYTMYFMGQQGTNSYLVLPRFTNDLSTLLVAFWMETERDLGTLSLGYITTGDVNFNTWQEIEAYDNYSDGMIQRVTYLGNLAEPIPSNAIHLVFRWSYMGYSSWYGACIDDVQVYPNGKVFYGGHANNGDFATDAELSQAIDWHNAYNWEPIGVPTLNDNVFIAPETTLNINDMWCAINEGNIGYANEVITDGESSLFIDGGQLIHNGEGTFANVQQWMYYYDAEYNAHDWYMVGLPFAEDVSAFSQGNLLPSYNSYTGQWTAVDLYKFDQTATDGLEWINFENGAVFPDEGGYVAYPNAFQLKPGTEEGYLYACGNNPGGYQKTTFKGILRRSDESVTANLTYLDGVRFAGWNLIGNPFACNATVSVSNYYTLNDDGNEIILNTDNELDVLEGIFVKAEAEGETVTFTRVSPTAGSATPGEAAWSGGGNLSLNVIREGNRIDLARVRFGQGRGLEKFQINENHTQVCFEKDGKDMAVVYHEGQVGELPVSFKAEHNGRYTFSFSNENVVFSYLHLIDNMTGNDVNLLVEPSYNFEAKTTDYASRFKLVFATGSSEDGDSNTFAFINGSGNLVIYGIEGEATLQVVDVLGHILSSEQFSGSYEKKLDVAPGAYMLRLISGDNVRVQKVVVR